MTTPITRLKRRTGPQGRPHVSKNRIGQLENILKTIQPLADETLALRERVEVLEARELGLAERLRERDQEIEAVRQELATARYKVSSMASQAQYLSGRLM